MTGQLANLREQIQKRLEGLVEDVSGAVDAALVVTSDGHIVAAANSNEISVSRLSAMSSSFMALGDAITAELGMGRCKNIISENETGVVVFMHITRNLVIVSVTGPRKSIGMLLSTTRNYVALIAEDIKNKGQAQ